MESNNFFNTCRFGKKHVSNCISLDIEWVKWLSYESEEEMSFLSKIKDKNLNILDASELNFINKYNSNKKMLDLIIKYQNNNCTSSEFLKVYTMLITDNICELMNSKLTAKEIETANHQIDELLNMSKQEIDRYRDYNSQIDVYNNLSMIDSYVLHKISDKEFVKKKKLKMGGKV